MNKITPFLWFDDKAEEAVHFYTSIFKNSKIGKRMSNNKELKARVVGIKHQPFAKAEMLIRRPVTAVF